MDFFETSAKTSEYIDNAFNSISTKLMQLRDESIEARKL